MIWSQLHSPDFYCAVCSRLLLKTLWSSRLKNFQQRRFRCLLCQLLRLWPSDALWWYWGGFTDRTHIFYNVDTLSEFLFHFNELLRASSCVCCGGVFSFSGRMACCIINVLVLNPQQGNSADGSPARTSTWQRIKKVEVCGRTVRMWHLDLRRANSSLRHTDTEIPKCFSIDTKTISGKKWRYFSCTNDASLPVPHFTSWNMNIAIIIIQ